MLISLLEMARVPVTAPVTHISSRPEFAMRQSVVVTAAFPTLPLMLCARNGGRDFAMRDGY